jgi:hypothetical protein
MFIQTHDKESAKKNIIAIGQQLIKRADDITNDLDKVTNITICANLEYGEIAKFDVTKNYDACFEESEVEE